jgi:BCCT family betaine/carnitine transporter
MFHWGLHPWAIYAVVALSLAFFHYNKGLPLTIRSAFYPLIKDHSWGWFGHLIDTIAVVATLFGLATSLGFGAQQASRPRLYLFGLERRYQYTDRHHHRRHRARPVLGHAGPGRRREAAQQHQHGLAGVLLLFVLVVGPTAVASSPPWARP